MSGAECDVELSSTTSHSDSGNSAQFHQTFYSLNKQKLFESISETGGGGFSDENMASKLRIISRVTKVQMFHFPGINLHFNLNTRMNFYPLTFI
jgi:hypothetical protein